jgi:hypothetical protein
MPPHDKNSHLSNKLQQIYASSPGIFAKLDNEEEALELSRKELQTLADTLLGERYDQAKVATVIKFQQALQVEQRRLARELQEKRIAPLEYLNLLTSLLVRTSEQCEQILGPDDFTRLFGVSAQETAHLYRSRHFLGRAVELISK